MHRIRRTTAEGFTLVELLVVIVVLGILAGVAVFAVSGTRDSAVQAACAADHQTLARAEEAYRVEATTYATETQLVDAGLLHAPSSSYDVVATPDEYSLVPTGECSGVGTAAAPTGVLTIGAVPASLVAGVVISPAITVTLQDALGNTMTSSTAALTLSLQGGAGAALSGTTTVNAVNGVATFSNLSISKSGTGYSLVASSPGSTIQASSTFVVAPAAPAQLAVVAAPPSGITAVAWPTQPVIAVQDALGNTVTTSSANVTLAITSGTGTAGAVLTCTSNPTAAAAGIATFAGCKISLAGTGYQLTATSPGLTLATTSAFSLSGVATKVVITQQPSAVVAGTVISPAVTVTVQDAAGKTVAASTAIVSLTLTTNPGASTLSGTISAAATAGVVTFDDVTLNKPGTGYKITAASTGVTSAVSNAFNVTVGAPAQLSFTVQPAGAKSRVAFTTQPKVTVQDALGNTITNSTATVTLTVTPGTGTPTAALSCTANPKAAIAGLVTFAGCKLSEPATDFTLTASSPGLTDAVSADFDNPVGPASKLIITQQPTNAVAGSPIAPSIAVAVQDAAGNIITASTATVTLTVTTNPGTSVLSGTTALSVTDGIATFGDISLNKTGTGYKLTAASTGLTSAVSSTFNIITGAPAKVAFTTQPNGGTINTAWTTQPKVTVQDALGNTITTSTASVTLTITTGTGAAGAALVCTANPKAAVAGAATFAGCKLNKTGSGYTLTATSAGLSTGLSNAFNIN